VKTLYTCEQFNNIKVFKKLSQKLIVKLLYNQRQDLFKIAIFSILTKSDQTDIWFALQLYLSKKLKYKYLE